MFGVKSLSFSAACRSRCLFTDHTKSIARRWHQLFSGTEVSRKFIKDERIETHEKLVYLYKTHLVPVCLWSIANFTPEKAAT